MNRWILALVAVVCSLPLAGTLARAAGTPSRTGLQVSVLRSLLTAHTGRAVAGHVDLRVGWHPAKARTNQVGGDMRLPDNSFAPATINTQFTGSETTADADQNYFRARHSQTYTALGMQGGFYERADWSPSDLNGGMVTFRYQGGLYGSATAAANAMQDGVTYVETQSSSKSTDCSGNGFRCSLLGYPLQNGDSEIYNVLQVNGCLIETATETPASLSDADTQQTAQTIVNIGSAAIGLPACTGAPGPNPVPSTTPTVPPTITIVSVGILHKVKGKVVTTKTLNGKETAEFVAFYQATNLGPYTPTGTLTISQGGSAPQSQSMEAQTASDGSTYFAYGAKMSNPKKTAKLTATFTLAAGPATSSATEKFTLKHKK